VYAWVYVSVNRHIPLPVESDELVHQTRQDV
jgi:hypothetical protein